MEQQQYGGMQQQVLPNVACCLCGVVMQPNPSRMCVNCLRNQVDVTDGISRQLVVQRCKGCARWSKPPFVHCEMESRELLALCLKKIKGLNQVRLIDASFLWTEPNSKRLKVKITVQKEVVHGAILQQNAVIDFIIQTVQCDDCKKSYTPHSWNANLQVRQKVEHKRSLLYLEQLILKNDAHNKVINIVEKSNGLDFEFTAKQHAERLADFVCAAFPAKKTYSKQLISHDAKCNTFFHKHTIHLELCPICKDDLIILPRKTAAQYGGVSSYLLCHKISTAVHLVDPMTLRLLDIPVEKYWKYKFDAALTRRYLTEFVVLNIENESFGFEPANNSQNNQTQNGHHQSTPFQTQAARASKYRVVQVEIARVLDLGANDRRVVVTSHLGNILHVGDHCEGYDLRTINAANFDANEYEAAGAGQLPEVILVKKVRPRGMPTKNRNWLLQCLPKQHEATTNSRKENRQIQYNDVEEFMQDLEEDPELRKGVNLWKDPRYKPVADDSVSDEEYANVKLAELLDGLTLEDGILQTSTTTAVTVPSHQGGEPDCDRDGDTIMQ